MSAFKQPQVLEGTGFELVPPNDVHHLHGLLRHVAETETPSEGGDLHGRTETSEGSVTLSARQYWRGARVQVTSEYVRFDAHLPGWLPTDSPDDIPPFAAVMSERGAHRRLHGALSPAIQAHLAEFTQVGCILPEQISAVCKMMNLFEQVEPTDRGAWTVYRAAAGTLTTYPLRTARSIRTMGVLALLDLGDFAFLLESPWWAGFWPHRAKRSGRPAHLHSSRVTECSFWVNPRELMERTLAEQEQP